MVMEKDLEEIKRRLQTVTEDSLNRDIVPIRDAIEVITGKWNVEILTGVLRGYCRFKELLNVNRGLTDKVLSKHLADLVEGRMLERRELYGYPPRVEYALTEHGMALYRAIEELKDWGYEHRRLVLGIK